VAPRATGYTRACIREPSRECRSKPRHGIIIFNFACGERSWESVRSTRRDDISTPFFVAVEPFEREMMYLRYRSPADGHTSTWKRLRKPYLSSPRPFPTAPSPSTLARRLTKVRLARPPTSVAATTVDAYQDAVEYEPLLLLPKLPYTTTAKEESYFPDLEPLFVPQSNPLPSERPPLRRSPTSVLMTRWSRVDVRDSVLIAELVELRRSVELANGDLQPDDNHRLVSEPWCNSCIYGSSSGDDDQRWRKAEKSAFCRRELIKTELTYLEGILQLENKNVCEFAVQPSFRLMCSRATVSIAAAHSPPGLPPGFNCRFLPITRPLPLRSNRIWGQFGLC